MSDAPQSPGTSAEVIAAQIKNAIAQDLGIAVAAEDIDGDASLEDDLDLDSVALMQLIAALEERLDFQFADEDLRMSSFQSVNVLARVIATRIDGDAGNADAVGAD